MALNSKRKKDSPKENDSSHSKRPRKDDRSAPAKPTTNDKQVRIAVPQGERTLDCSFCDISYELKKKQNFKNHLVAHFKEQIFPQLPKEHPLKCPKCDHVESRDLIGLSRHYALTHKLIFEFVTEEQYQGVRTDKSGSRDKLENASSDKKLKNASSEANVQKNSDTRSKKEPVSVAKGRQKTKTKSSASKKSTARDELTGSGDSKGNETTNTSKPVSAKSKKKNKPVDEGNEATNTSKPVSAKSKKKNKPVEDTETLGPGWSTLRNPVASTSKAATQQEKRAAKLFSDPPTPQRFSPRRI